LYKKLLLILIIIIFTSFPISAEESQDIEVQTTNAQNSDTPYLLTADGEISYDNKQGVLVASNNARFESDGIMIVADEIAVFYEDNIVKAVGELRIQVAEQIYQGSSLDFNYYKLTGSISGVSSKINDLSVSGKSITLNEGTEFEIDEVELTPCVLPDPHYSIKAKRVKVYPQDKIVAKAVWFYLNGYRVFYVPAYTVKFNKSSGKFENLFIVSSLGYNSIDGIYLKLAYPYELTDRLEGSIDAEINQYGDKYFEMENTYRVSSKLDILNSYYYQEEEDDGEIKETNELIGGLHYRNNGLDIHSLYKRDFLIDKNIIEIDTKYKPQIRNNGLDIHFLYKHDFLIDENIIEIDTKYKYQKYDFRYFNKFTASDLSNEIYSIRYNRNSPLQLLYKKGFKVDYLPYLSIEQLEYSYSGIDTNSSLGIGKVANKDISSDKARLDLGIDKKFEINEKFVANLYGQLEANYYINDDNVNSPAVNHYNYYLLGFNTKMISDINEKITIDYSLGYNYSWETGEAYLPEDKNEVKEIINPAVAITYHFPEYQSSLKLDIQGSYELNSRNLEDLNIKLKRQLDCYSYYLGYDLVDEAFEFGINF